MKKIYLFFKNIVLCCLFFAVLAYILTFFAPVFRYDEDAKSTGLLKTFYSQPKDSCDIVTIGTSSVYAGILPAYIYGEYDITAVNYATSGLPAECYETLIDEVIDYQHPDVIMIELRNYIRFARYYEEGAKPMSEGTLENRESYINGVVNNMPYTSVINRSKIINDAVPVVLEPDEDIFDWHFEYMKTHNNWKNVGISTASKYFKQVLTGQADQIDNEDYDLDKYNGTSKSKKSVENPTPNYTAWSNKYEDISGEYLQVLDGIIEKAKSLKDTKIVLFTIPYSKSTKDSRAAYENWIEKYCLENGVDFVNGNSLVKEMGIDFKYDYFDTTHTNITGAKKVTSYMVEYLIDKYDLKKSTLTKEQKKDWDKIKKTWYKECLAPSEEYISKIKASR